MSFENIRVIIGFILFIGLGLNLLIQFIQAIRKMNAVNYAKDTVHTFKCRNCEETYSLNGEKAKERISIWSTQLNTRTPKSQTAAIRFECAKCHQKSFHERIFDIDETGLAGNLRIQLTDETRNIVVGLLIKGFLPIFLATPILGVIFP